MKKDIGKIKNRQEAFKYHPQPDDLASQMLQEQLDLLETQLATLEKDIQEQLPETDTEDIKWRSSVKGIGQKTAVFLLCFTRGFKDFSDPKALANSIGIAPTIYQSGKYQKNSAYRRKEMQC